MPAKVFRHKKGEVVAIDPAEIVPGKRLVLPPLPRVHKPRAEQLKSLNRIQLQNKPWTLGLVESMAALEVIARQRLETRNRIALILLDSSFEIALKEFIVHRPDLFPAKEFDDAAIRKLFDKRYQVIKAVSDKVTIPRGLLDKASHYYDLRNKLIHERATVGIVDSDVGIYRSTIEEILGILFQLRFSD